jgi:myo-inositol 2-dehydrogenase/D-chiro-inositol 1-dehydrogenase
MLDTAVVTLTWADGRIAVIKNSRRAGYGYDQRIELLSSKGLLSAKNVLENTVEKITAEGAQSAKPVYFSWNATWAPMRPNGLLSSRP